MSPGPVNHRKLGSGRTLAVVRLSFGGVNPTLPRGAVVQACVGSFLGFGKTCPSTYGGLVTFVRTKAVVGGRVWLACLAVRRINRFSFFRTPGARDGPVLCAPARRVALIGGLIVWMGHDSFPCIADTSILDFQSKPKPAALAFRKRLEEV